MDDTSIIDLYWQRSEDAIKETNKRYGAYCHCIADNILHNKEDAEECVNDTWLNAWNSMPTKRPEKLKFYLAKITRNLSFNKWKAQTSKKRGGGEMTVVLQELEESLAGDFNVEDAYLTKMLAKSINDFVQKLPERECNVFVRRYFFTEPIAVISKRYQLSENNVMVMLSRVRRKLKEQLRQEGYFIEQ